MDERKRDVELVNKGKGVQFIRFLNGNSIYFLQTKIARLKL